MNIKLLTEHHLEFLNLKGGYTGSHESTLVKMPLLGITCHGSNVLHAWIQIILTEGAGPENVLVINVFHRGPYAPPS